MNVGGTEESGMHQERDVTTTTTHAAGRDAGPDAAIGAGDPRLWRRTLAAGSFEVASRERRIAIGEGHEADDGGEGAAVRALVDLQGLLRDKSWKRAVRRLAELDSRPPLVDWPSLEEEVEGLTRAGAALERREVDEALAALEPPGPEAPRGPRLLEAEHRTLLGTALILDGRGGEAEEHFERALERDPKHYRAMVNLGNVALEDGRTDRAIELYEAALALEEDFPNAHHNLGVAYRRQGQIGKSVRSLRRAQKADRVRQSTDARESVRDVGGALRGRWLRWAVWGGVAAVVVWLLMTRG